MPVVWAVGTVIGPGGKLLKKDVQLEGFIISDGDSPILERGFYYGKELPLTEFVISGDITPTFLCIAKADVGDFYYQAYSTNAIGEGLGEIKTIVIP